MAEDNSTAAAQSSLTGTNQLASWRLVTVIGSLCLGVFLFGLDVNIVTVAIPHITTEFRSLPDIAWYGLAYLLTLTAFQPLFGNLYKYFNAKVVYMISLALFEVGSVICAAAPTSAVLIFGRAWLGLGAAGLLQGALAIINYTVAVDKVPLFQGIVVGSMAVAVCCGPVIGGALTQYANWPVQAVLEPEDIATGNAINVFSFHLAGAVGTAIGQALLIDGLNVAVPRYTDAVTPAAVIGAGATGLQLIATSPAVLEALRAAYVEAVRRTIVLGLAGICMTVPVSCAMEWINIKSVAETKLRALASKEMPARSRDLSEQEAKAPESI
ncbi:hypothetical protein Daesc_005648 [Daldinia eschscholtzii]|uniref:Major facilitator superfamily (MFS) profile domain-containing protein n=1 Tax=Daldinia eschscholtzii TaxID=292717 RepID=A0AAX6ML32_9PEZI